MKKIFILSSLFILLTCSKEFDNPISSDEDLKHKPNILQISTDSNIDISIILDYSYSEASTIVLERKSIGGFESINFIKQTQTTLVDTSFNKESNHDFVYRVSVRKDKYRSSYSKEQQFVFTSSGLYKPDNLLANSLELQGISLTWNDKSHLEDGYIVEKNDGSGFIEIVTLSSNIQTYLDAIVGTPATPLQLQYRVKAFNSTLESDWVIISTEYSGLGAPTNLKFVGNVSSYINIEWDDNSSIETGYSIERKKDSESFSEIAQVGSNIFIYSDIISDSGTYNYRVRTIKDGSYSTYSNEISAEINNLIPTAGLLAYYPFHGNANDESINENDGTLYGPILSTDRFGSENSAYYFDGSNDYIDIGNDNSLKPQLPITISAWIWVENFNDYRPVFGSEFNPGHYYGIYFSVPTSRKVRIMYGNGGFGDSARRHKLGTSVLEIQTWYHIVGIIEGPVDMKIFINGVEDAGEYVGSGSGLVYGDSPGVIGKYNLGSITPYFHGIIDDIYFYDRALSEKEIQILYHADGWDQ